MAAMTKMIAAPSGRPTAILRRLFLQAACLCLLPALASADDSIFLPDALSSSDSGKLESLVGTLSNDALAMQAEFIRSTEMSAEHRTLNHHWLSVHSNRGQDLQGGRAFSRIAQKVLRQYWREKRQELGDNRLLPDDEGNFKRRFNGIDYGLSTSGGGLNFGLNYQF